MKKNFVAVAAVCAFILTGCSGSDDYEIMPAPTPEETIEPADTADPVPESQIALVGGWAINTEAESSLTEEEAALFEEASDGFSGVGYKPVAVIAKQIVSGTNYAYLCTSETIAAEPEYGWSVVVVYEDLEGNATFMNIKDVDPTSPATTEEVINEEFSGRWEVLPASGMPAAMLNEEIQTAADAVKDSVEGLSLEPIALISTQLVSGMNYKVLMRGTADDSESPSLYVTTIYRDLQGNSSITDNQLFDIEYYTDMAIYD